MINLIRETLIKAFGRTLKTNESLNFAVLTGCLRISKESIFTGLNNFKAYTVKDVRYNEYFGFTDSEIREMLEYYGFMGQYDAIKEWYDGYSDICIEVYDGDIGIKYAENAAFDAACAEAIKQARDKKYEEVLIDDGMKVIYRYGIACYKKRCKVVSEEACLNFN